MKATSKRRSYSARRSHRYAYPNAADSSYFAEKLLDGVTAVVTSMGTITVLLYLIVMF